MGKRPFYSLAWTWKISDFHIQKRKNKGMFDGDCNISFALTTSNCIAILNYEHGVTARTHNRLYDQPKSSVAIFSHNINFIVDNNKYIAFKIFNSSNYLLFSSLSISMYFCIYCIFYIHN